MNNKISAIILTMMIFGISSCSMTSDEVLQDGKVSSSEITEESSMVNELKTRKIKRGYRSVIDEYAENTMEYLVNKDTEGLKTLFSDMSNENYSLGDEIDRAYDFLGGDIISFGEIESHTGGSTFGGGHTSRQTGTSYIYEVKTDKDEFEIFIGCVIINDDDISQVGIQNIKIKNSSFEINDPDREENMVSIGKFLGSWYG